MRTILAALFVLGGATGASADPTNVVYQIDFGPATTCAPGFLPVEAKPSDPRFFWKGHALSMRDRGGDDLLHRDFVHGDRGEFTVGLDNGRYEVEVTFGDSNYAHGPFSVLAQGQVVVAKLTTAKGKFVSKVFPATVEDERLRIGIIPVEGGVNFTVTSMVIRGPKQRGVHRARLGAEV